MPHKAICTLLITSSIRDYPFNTYAKFSEKLTFLTPSYAHILVRDRG